MAETKTSLFTKEILARLTGDSDSALANKIARKALSAIKSQIASLEASVVDAEVSVEEAKEKLDAAMYPTEMFTSTQSYITDIVRAKNNLNEREEALSELQESLEFFKEQEAKFSSPAK